MEAIKLILNYTGFIETLRLANTCKKINVFSIIGCNNNWDKLMHIRMRIYDRDLIKNDTFHRSLFELAGFPVVKYLAKVCYKPELLIIALNRFPSLYEALFRSVITLHVAICEKCLTSKPHLDKPIITKIMEYLEGLDIKAFAERNFDYVAKSNSFAVWRAYRNRFQILPAPNNLHHKLARFYFRIGLLPVKLYPIILHYKECSEECLKQIKTIHLLPNNKDVVVKWIIVNRPDINTVMHWFFTKDRGFHINWILKCFDEDFYKIPKHPYFLKHLLVKYSKYVDITNFE